jgi:transcriptional regulator GlxA family with amidase domain
MPTGEQMMMDRIDSALGMLRTELVERIAQDDWKESQAEQAIRAAMTWLQTVREAPSEHQAPRGRLSSEALRSTLRYINDNMDSKLTWHEIAARVGLDAFTFGRGFKCSTGMTPHQYVVRCRIRRAMKLLASGKLSVADIALEVGCSCQSHLTTLFRKYTGTTPAAFRRAARDTRYILRTTGAKGVPPLQMPRPIALRGQATLA